jgi:hypothetical protein
VDGDYRRGLEHRRCVVKDALSLRTEAGLGETMLGETTKARFVNEPKLRRRKKLWFKSDYCSSAVT